MEFLLMKKNNRVVWFDYMNAGTGRNEILTRQAPFISSLFLCLCLFSLVGIFKFTSL